MKKVSQDKHTATFRNNDGHEVRVSLKSLSPDMKKKLDQLPVHKFKDGGSVLPDPIRPGPGMSSDADTPQDYTYKPDEWDMARDSIQPILPTTPTDINDATSVNPGQIAANANADAHSSSGIGSQAQGSGASGDWSASPSDTSAPPTNAQAPDQSQPQAPVSADQGQTPSSSGPAPASTDAPPVAAVPKTPPEAAAKMRNDLQTEFNSVQADKAAGHIAPKTFHDMFMKNPDGSDRGVGSKIGTIFGLLAGGIGSGLTHQPNALLEMMNKTIDRDWDAQQQNTGNKFKAQEMMQKQTALEIQNKLANSGISLNSQQGQAIAAETRIKNQAFYQMMHTNTIMDDLRKKVANLPPGSPQATAMNQQLAMMSQAENAKYASIENFAAGRVANMNMWMNQGQSPDGQQGTDPEQKFVQQQKMARMMGGDQGKAYADLQKEGHVSGFEGTAGNIDKDTANELQKRREFDGMVQHVRSWADQHSKLINPIDRQKSEAYGTTQLTGLQTKYRELQGMGSLKGFDIPLLDKELGSHPMSIWNSLSGDPKLKAAQDLNKQELNQKAHDNGLKPLPLQSWESGGGSSGSAPSGQQFKQVTYKGQVYRVPVK